jgi:hypothetical protein
MPTQTVSLSVVDGTTTFSVVDTVTDAQARAVGPLTLASSTTNSEVDIVLTRADVRSMTLSTVGGDLTIKTNSTSSPGDTVTLAAGTTVVFVASASGIQAVGTIQFPTADVTKLFLSSTAGTVFTLRAIVTAANG